MAGCSTPTAAALSRVEVAEYPCLAISSAAACRLRVAVGLRPLAAAGMCLRLATDAGQRRSPLSLPPDPVQTEPAISGRSDGENAMATLELNADGTADFDEGGVYFIGNAT